MRTTRRELMRVIRAVDEEIQSVFAAAFVDVAANFERLFITLFPGGSGKLVLTDPADLLETGVEVEAKPSGKNVKKLSLLSGGERSLTALAFLFAVFRSRPSPFYVMDEVEAALDDVNLHRFLGLIAEFRQEAQLLDRQPPEADDGGRRLPARRHHAAGRLVARDHRAGRGRPSQLSDEEVRGCGGQRLAARSPPPAATSGLAGVDRLCWRRAGRRASSSRSQPPVANRNLG